MSDTLPPLPPLPEPAFTVVDLGRAGVCPACYTADQMRAYAAAAVAAERERCAELCWDRRGHFASDAAARAFAELVRNGTPGAEGV